MVFSMPFSHAIQALPGFHVDAPAGFKTYKFSVTSSNNYLIVVSYEGTGTQEHNSGDITEMHYTLPWVTNIDNWMKSGMISYQEHQNALKWIVENTESKK